MFSIIPKSYNVLRHCSRCGDFLKLSIKNSKQDLLHWRRWKSSTTEDEKSNTNWSLSSFPVERIRNFSIIAHVDHGKSTLADRILEITGAIVKDDNNKQVLDKLQVERERGITVKAQSVSIVYRYKDEDYLLNLIDTPGHVDFQYEVSRSLSACDGVLLLVDANQGVQAQTVANHYLASENNLKIIPVLNKIDLKNADTEQVTEQMMTLFDTDPEDVLKVSAKLGIGINEVLEAVIKCIPPPKCSADKPLRALLFDSWFNQYLGVVGLMLIVDGTIKVGDYISSYQTKKSYEVKNLGILKPEDFPVSQIYAGQVGYVTANLKTISEAQIGDTFHHKNVAIEALSGFKAAKPMVFAGVYPMTSSELHDLKSALERLTLNDSSVSIIKETSIALGQGWRLGFLGLLHMDVFNQRLEQEFGAQVVITTPTVTYKVELKDVKATKRMDKMITVSNPSDWPDQNHIAETYEPMVVGTVITPVEFLNDIRSLCLERRGYEVSLKDVDEFRVMVKFKMPLNEIIVDFYDALKSLSSGYASFDYEDADYERTSLVKMHYLLNDVAVEELTTIVHIDRAQQQGRKICIKLTESIPKQLYKIAVQAAIGKKILAREDIRALRKDVLAKCYGGDVSRKMKLLERQKAGKKQMKMYGNIEVPRETFINILKL